MINNITSHTADIGIKEKAKSLKDLFKRCADKIIKFSLRKKHVKKKLEKNKLVIKNKSNSYEQLLHDFLNEIIFFIFTQKKYPVKIIIDGLSLKKIRANIFYGEIKEDEILRELKSVTYHNLTIKKGNSFFIAEIIIDT